MKPVSALGSVVLHLDWNDPLTLSTETVKRFGVGNEPDGNSSRKPTIFFRFQI
jgi:hypothetical protein